MRLLLSIFICTIFLSFNNVRLHAQAAKVLSAFNYLGYGELDKAREYIDVAINDEKSKIDAKTWVYRGRIYKAIYRSKDPKYKNLDPDALVKGYESFKKAAELDVKNKYKDEIVLELKNSGIELTNEGITTYNTKNFGLALKYCELAIEATSSPLVNTVDTVAYKVGGIAALNLNNNEKAKAYLRKLISYNYETLNSYLLLTEVYLAEKDTVGYLSAIQEARKLFPSNNDLATREINIYIFQNKVPEAIENITLAIKNEPNNYILYSNLGILYQKIKENDKAETTYKKAIEVNPNGFDALYNLGALYYNIGVEKILAANDLPRSQTAKFDEYKKKAAELFNQAKPYIEKALDITELALTKDSKNNELIQNKKDALTSLKLLYYNLENDAKYQEVSDKLQNL